MNLHFLPTKTGSSNYLKSVEGSLVNDRSFIELDTGAASFSSRKSLSILPASVFVTSIFHFERQNKEKASAKSRIIMVTGFVFMARM